MIGFIHAAGSDGVWAGFDHVPRPGELLYLDGKGEGQIPDGIYRVENIMYQFPSSPGNQRVDIYTSYIGEIPKSLAYDAMVAVLAAEDQ